jgi:glucose-6-phosphate 1-dehydrogenase
MVDSVIDNPFAGSDGRLASAPPTALVIFGASGDLTKRKLIPALYNLAHDNLLPSNFFVLGVSRSKMTNEGFREHLREAATQFSRRPLNPAVWDAFAANVFYEPMDATHPGDYARLQERLAAIEAERGGPLNYLYYLASAPDFFSVIAANLKKAGLIAEPGDGNRRTSIIIEKPFGHDLASARELNVSLRQSLSEQQIFRIDHYLGKETVQNILVFRFANGIFEPLWNHRYIDHIQISVCESIGVATRGGYFDSTGILRDVVQNHLLQILSLLCIEPPISLSDPNSIRDEKVKVLRSIKRFREEDVFTNAVRGQYVRGYIDGDEVPGYLEESGIAPGSMTETFVSLKLEIDNWRWYGVPIYVRAGKRLPKRISEITIFFKRAPDSLFQGQELAELEQNVLTIQVQPNEGISLRISAKPPGPRLRVRPVVMDFAYGDFFAGASPEAYERLLLDAMKGDSTLFIRDDEIEHSWDLLEPILKSWASDSPPPLDEYESGTWGPSSAARLLAGAGHKWRRL